MVMTEHLRQSLLSVRGNSPAFNARSKRHSRAKKHSRSLRPKPKEMSVVYQKQQGLGPQEKLLRLFSEGKIGLVDWN